MIFILQQLKGQNPPLETFTWRHSHGNWTNVWEEKIYTDTCGTPYSREVFSLLSLLHTRITHITYWTLFSVTWRPFTNTYFVRQRNLQQRPELINTQIKLLPGITGILHVIIAPAATKWKEVLTHPRRFETHKGQGVFFISITTNYAVTSFPQVSVPLKHYCDFWRVYPLSNLLNICEFFSSVHYSAYSQFLPEVFEGDIFKWKDFNSKVYRELGIKSYQPR